MQVPVNLELLETCSEGGSGLAVMAESISHLQRRQVVTVRYNLCSCFRATFRGQAYSLSVDL